MKFHIEYKDRIYHIHVKEFVRDLHGVNSILASYLIFSDVRRGWDFVSPGRGGVPFLRVYRALNATGYESLLSVEWEDKNMNRDRERQRR